MARQDEPRGTRGTIYRDASMKIALDYDRTYNVDREFWDVMIEEAFSRGHEVRIVTARSPKNDCLSEQQVTNSVDRARTIYCDGIAKRFFCHWFADDGLGWDPDVWIDDKPQGVDANSNATREILDNWRVSPEYLK